CLEKNPERRYSTARELADDLRAYLEGRPIAARPVGAFGRLRRWCLREPAAAGLLALLTIAILSGWAGVGLAWRRAQAERKLAVIAMKKAEANFKTARDIVDDLADAAGQMWGRPELEKSRREILERVARFHASFLEERSDDPTVMERSANAELLAALIR